MLMGRGCPKGAPPTRDESQGRDFDLGVKLALESVNSGVGAELGRNPQASGSAPEWLLVTTARVLLGPCKVAARTHPLVRLLVLGERLAWPRAHVLGKSGLSDVFENSVVWVFFPLPKRVRRLPRLFAPNHLHTSRPQ